MTSQDKSFNEWKIPLYKIYTDDEDINLITKIVKRGTLWAIGPEIEEFEKAIKNYVGVEYCVCLNSGTSALHAAYLAHGLKSGDEVIVPSFSFISTANSVLFVGATPVFADIEEKTRGLDPESITQKITPKTKAVVPMDYGGLSCQISEISKVAKENNLTVIEDAAECLGASVNGKKSGSLSDTAIFSFCGNKVLTTGEGGAIVTSSKEIYEKIKLIRSHGRVDKVSYFNNPLEAEYVNVGYNWRMSSITASLGISQLGKLDKLVRMRQQHASYLSSRLSKYKQITVPSPPPGYEHIYQMYTIMLPNEKTRNDLQEHLLNKRIFCKVYFDPIHLKPFYKQKYGTKENQLPVTEDTTRRVLTLPIYPNMTTEEKDYLVQSIAEFFDRDN